MSACFVPDDSFPQEIAGFTARRPPVSWARRLADFDHRIFARDAWPEPVWAEELAGDSRTYIALETSPLPLRSFGEIVAVGGVSYYDDGEILTLAVAPEFRRQGVGKHLLNVLLDIADQRGVSRTFLEVRSKHTGVQDMYRAAGFSQIAVRKKYYSDDDAVVMVRESQFRT
ncbi:GNAT family N-acetyltransferase [Arcanobacterium phocisimile]|uniref:GNAT family N-acetyltransferase n=1 Tax=Arcanobacterium phocisimile TaxID=1302235 RepID=A0ABX7IH57_9ACTO|nr:GNAT family N-acetyltransferase [Arcanobacterium phocisimile]QRV01799.1 GNAT family N-acetyltransferase [Arcanobacterium phocisimile]